MKREILISPVVERELDHLLDSIAARSPAGALATLQAFRRQLELLGGTLAIPTASSLPSN